MINESEKNKNYNSSTIFIKVVQKVIMEIMSVNIMSLFDLVTNDLISLHK